MKLIELVGKKINLDQVPDTVEVPASLAEMMFKSHAYSLGKGIETGAFLLRKDNHFLFGEPCEGKETEVTLKLTSTPMWLGQAVGTFHTHPDPGKNGTCYPFSNVDLCNDRAAGWCDFVQADGKVLMMVFTPANVKKIPAHFQDSYDKLHGTLVEYRKSEQKEDTAHNPEPHELVDSGSQFTMNRHACHGFNRAFYVGSNGGTGEPRLERQWISGKELELVNDLAARLETRLDVKKY